MAKMDAVAAIVESARMGLGSAKAALDKGDAATAKAFIAMTEGMLKSATDLLTKPKAE